MRLTGPLSRRLRSLFGQDVSTWPAHREPEEIHDMPRENYIGHAVSPPCRTVGRHRKEPRS